MTSSIKFPSARQPVTLSENGTEVFTRPWFLFFQAVYERVGGASGPSVLDLSESLFEDAGTGETNAMLFDAQQAFEQLPRPLVELIEQLTTSQQTLLSEVAELRKELDAIKQGPTL